MSEDTAASAPEVRIVAPGDGHSVAFLDGSTMSFLAQGSETDGLVSFWEFTLPPGGNGPPLHVHHGHDEIFYVLNGQLKVFTADTTLDVQRGSLVLVPRGAPHTFANAGATTMQMVGTFSPARFEGYFDELAAEIHKHGGARPDSSTIAGLYARYDSDLVG